MKRIALGVVAALAGVWRTRAGAAARPADLDHDGDAALAHHPAVHPDRHPDAPRGHPETFGGRISVTLASWPERNLNGPELLRVLRAGQIDLGGIALPTVAGDAPLLDIIDLAGLLSSHEMGRKVAEAVMPDLDRSWSASA